MNAKEFKEFCHLEFTKRGFKKKKNMYYLKGKDLLCGLYLQKSIGPAYYVEYNFFIGKFDDPKNYPTYYEADLYYRFLILSKDTYKGKHFMGALFEYGEYTADEIRPYFDETFEKYIMPPILNGKESLWEYIDIYAVPMSKDKNEILNKLKA